MKRTPLLRKTSISRTGPIRRAAAKVVGMMRKPHRPVTTAAERRHLGRVAERGCCVCQRPATVHHVTSDGMKRITRTHARTVPLCPDHHMIQFGPRESVEALGHAGFTALHGIDLLVLADWLWAESLRIEQGSKAA